MAALAALLCFLLALFGVQPGIDLTLLGLAFVSLHLLIGTWPLGLIRRQQ
jgi:hypothetical protein